MRFNTLSFALFLLIVSTVVWQLPPRARRWWLLVVSWAFYVYWRFPQPYLLLLLGCGILNHFGAAWIMRAERRSRRGAVVLAANLLLLGVFKYADWVVENVNVVASTVNSSWSWSLPRLILPLGVSFFVFEGISYIVDVIRKRERLHGFWDFQLFMAFFPKLIAGPIMRAKELLPQIENPANRLTPSAVLESAWLLGTGLLLKVLADGISAPIDRAFALVPQGLGALDVLVMAAAFGIQIYFDFSSYSRMACGSALLCGVRLVDNFNYPYRAVSPADFWNRWHMSLSRWIRDYVFFPLVGKQATLGAMCRAALLAMTLCGVWHRPGWNFVLWGFYHGCLIAGYHIATYRSRQSAGSPDQTMLKPWLTRYGGIAATYSLVTLGWIWFRSTSLSQALTLWEHVLMPWRFTTRALPGTFYLHAAVLVTLTLTAPAWFALWKRLTVRGDNAQPAAELGPAWFQGMAVGLMIVIALIYYEGQAAFIYFQF